MKVRFVALAVILLMMSIGGKNALSQEALSLEKALKKARVDGKYGMLLQQIKVSEDFDGYGDFHEYGLWENPEYAGYTDLPGGYWVYVYPCWFIWRDDLTKASKGKRPWGPEQSTGEPDTPEAGDFGTAWASKTPDEQDERLLLEYAEPVVPASIKIYETYNPGAVNKVSIFTLEGKEVTVWKGDDPTAVGSGKGVSEIPIKVKFKTNLIKIYLNSPDVQGWNEIDAVGLVDSSGKTQWATAAEASSTYAQETAPDTTDQGLTEQRLKSLEKEVQELKEEVEKLKDTKNKSR